MENDKVMMRLLNKVSLALQGRQTIWTTHLLLLASVVFLDGFGQGLLGAARTNFFVDTLGLSGNQVLWLEGIREIPGLALIFIAALMMHLPLTRRAALAVFIMGLGNALYVTVNSYVALLLIEVFASLGMHMWMPLHSSLAMTLSGKDKAGQVLGSLSSVAALAGIAGMGAIALTSRIAITLPLGMYYLVGGGFIMVAGLLLTRLPADIGTTEAEPPRLLIKGRYWLYYALEFLQGARKQVLNTFGILVLVERFGLAVPEISLLLLVSSVINLVSAPRIGKLLDRLGERTTVTLSYIVLILCCIGFAVIHQVWPLVFLLIVIRLMTTVNMGLSTYVYRIAPAEELTPTLSAGVSINHVTSVAMPLIAGAVLPFIGYEGIFLATGVLVLLAVPFTLNLHITTAAPIRTAGAG